MNKSKQVNKASKEEDLGLKLQVHLISINNPSKTVPQDWHNKKKPTLGIKTLETSLHMVTFISPTRAKLVTEQKLFPMFP